MFVKWIQSYKIQLKFFFKKNHGAKCYKDYYYFKNVLTSSKYPLWVNERPSAEPSRIGTVYSDQPGELVRALDVIATNDALHAKVGHYKVFNARKSLKARHMIVEQYPKMQKIATETAGSQAVTQYSNQQVRTNVLMQAFHFPLRNRNAIYYYYIVGGIHTAVLHSTLFTLLLWDATRARVRLGCWVATCDQSKESELQFCNVDIANRNCIPGFAHGMSEKSGASCTRRHLCR